MEFKFLQKTKSNACHKTHQVKNFNQNIFWYFRYAYQKPEKFIIRFLRKIILLVNPNRPRLAIGSKKILDQLLKPNMTIGEMGSGYSTIYFAGKVLNVVSVESDRYWYEFLKKKKIDNLKLFYVTQKSKYTKKIFQMYKKYDLIIVDGKFRKECFENSWKYSKRGTWIVLDDTNRIEYKTWLKKYPKPILKKEDVFKTFSTSFFKK